VLLYTLGVSQSLSSRAPPGTAASALFLPVVLMIAQLAFAIAALIVLRGSTLAGVFVRAQPHLDLPPLFRPAALFVLVFAGVWLLQILMGVVVNMTSVRRQFYVVHLLPYSGEGTPPLRVLDIVLALLVAAAFVVGAVLVLARRASGIVWITIACLVRLSFSAAIWASYPTNYGIYGATPTALEEVYEKVTRIANGLPYLLWIGLILLIFTWRPSPSNATATLPPPRPAPPPIPQWR
jgi:hypothetical protein